MFDGFREEMVDAGGLSLFVRQGGSGLDQPIRRLLDVDEVATVHVRAVQSQCFAYSVTR